MPQPRQLTVSEAFFPEKFAEKQVGIEALFAVEPVHHELKARIRAVMQAQELSQVVCSTADIQRALGITGASAHTTHGKLFFGQALRIVKGQRCTIIQSRDTPSERHKRIQTHLFNYFIPKGVAKMIQQYGASRVRGRTPAPGALRVKRPPVSARAIPYGVVGLARRRLLRSLDQDLEFSVSSDESEDGDEAEAAHSGSGSDSDSDLESGDPLKPPKVPKGLRPRHLTFININIGGVPPEPAPAPPVSEVPSLAFILFGDEGGGGGASASACSSSSSMRPPLVRNRLAKTRTRTTTPGQQSISRSSPCVV